MSECPVCKFTSSMKSPALLSVGHVRRLCKCCSPWAACDRAQAWLTDGLKKDISALLTILEPVRDAINVVQSNTALLSDLASAYLTLYDKLSATTKLPSFLDAAKLSEIASNRTWNVFLPVHVSTWAAPGY